MSDKTPITREEIFMTAAASGTSANITPITRREMFFAKAAGMDVEIPAPPITREEMFLEKIIESKGSSSEVEEYDGTIIIE